VLDYQATQIGLPPAIRELRRSVVPRSFTYKGLTQGRSSRFAGSGCSFAPLLKAEHSSLRKKQPRTIVRGLVNQTGNFSNRFLADLKLVAELCA
jgi:hypothetical protein